MTASDNPVTAGGLLPEGPPPGERQSGYQPNISDLLKQRHAQTTSRLAGWLLGMLGGTVVVHYVCIMILILLKRDESTKVLEDFYHGCQLYPGLLVLLPLTISRGMESNGFHRWHRMAHFLFLEIRAGLCF